MQRELIQRRLAARLSSSGVRSHPVPPEADLSPLQWNQFFDHRRDIRAEPSAVFRVYSHGLTLDAQESPLLVLLHGGGYSALSWAPFVRQIVGFCSCRVLAIDLRGHGSSRTDDDLDLSMRTLVQDVVAVLDQMFVSDRSTSSGPDDQPATMQATMEDIGFCPQQDDAGRKNVCPPLILIGHSMGGALAVHVAHELANSAAGYDVRAVVVIDVVEGTALAALDCMQRVLLNRPNSFSSIRSAIRWCLESGQTKNIEAARVSFPGQIKSKKTQLTASDDLFESENTDQKMVPISASATITEEDEEDLDEGLSQSIDRSVTCADTSDSANKTSNDYVWRVDLPKSSPHWQGWFEGLSTLFLSAPVQNRLLILAGMDRLDKDLTIGQMQGKFQLQVLPQTGHAIHEDVPDRVAEVIAHSLKLNKSKCNQEIVKLI